MFSEITPDETNRAAFDGTDLPATASNLTVKVQILLDRAGASPGVIDGIVGDNVGKAISAFEAMHGLPVDGILDNDVWSRLVAHDDGAVLVAYTVTGADLAGPFLGELPTDYAALAALDRLSFANPAEMFSERFHMDVDFLLALNGGMADLRSGTVITVAAIGERVATPVVRLEADVSLGQLRGYDAEGRLVVAYPATMGSTQTPSPTGRHTVAAIATDAAYYYRPGVKFQQGANAEPLTLPPGPNNPIGTVWIDLSEPTYGIHGTPEPAEVDKTSSHGCVRLATWDVEELAALVQLGAIVEFL
jgi:lipoprotein-anchoring transpeptidase ErfK/SrfK